MKIHRKRIRLTDLLTLRGILDSDLAKQFEQDLANEGISLESRSSVSSNQYKVRAVYRRYLEKIEEQRAAEAQDYSSISL